MGGAATSLLVLVAAEVEAQTAAAAAGGDPQSPPDARRAAGDKDEAESGDDDPVRTSQNPVSKLTTVPLLENLDYGMGPFDRAQSTLNVQAVAPMTLTERWSLLIRTIVPLVYQPDPLTMTGGSSGQGDVAPTLFISPARPGKLIWGAGVAAVLPLATQPSLGTAKWSAGPSAVVLVQPRRWTLGVLASQVWSVAGPAHRPDVDMLTVQYFINYDLPRRWYLTSQPVITANWEAPSGSQWLVPFGGGVGKLFKIGKLPVNAQLAAYHHGVRPEMAPSPSWQLRFQIAFLFPR
jgi:hypothetical protein